MREAPEALWQRSEDAWHEASISMTSTRPRGWRTSKAGQSPSPEKRYKLLRQRTARRGEASQAHQRGVGARKGTVCKRCANIVES